jgi:hypothetical protein
MTIFRSGNSMIHGAGHFMMITAHPLPKPPSGPDSTCKRSEPSSASIGNRICENRYEFDQAPSPLAFSRAMVCHINNLKPDKH